MPGAAKSYTPTKSPSPVPFAPEGSIRGVRDWNGGKGLGAGKRSGSSGEERLESEAGPLKEQFVP